MPKVTMIPATKNYLTHTPSAAVHKRRVAGYARVSTDSDEQFTSYEAQVDYYTKFIQSKSEWEFVKVYTDEGISGTNIKHRDGFNRMIKDALDGKIDLIVTKSVSRFARNTVDSLMAVRKLKDAGVEVYFEKENIYTFDGKGELLITIMSSLAQEESRSISENVTWGQRKRFADGKVSLPFKHFLGYDRGENGQPVINEKEAEVVRLIYRLFMSGKTSTGICKHLNSLGIPTPSGKTGWSQTTVASILTNEKYKGDALLQKKFTVDFLTKKQKVNEGEIPQYYVKDSHPAIISPLEFDIVQAEIARRRRVGRSFSGASVFSGKIICEECGGFYGQKVWHSNDPYRKVVWRCIGKSAKQTQCDTPDLEVDVIKRRFLTAYNQLMSDRQSLLDDCEDMRKVLSDCTQLDTEIEALNAEMEIVSEMVLQFDKNNSSLKQSPNEYIKKYNALIKRYDKAVADRDAAVEERRHRKIKEREMSVFISELEKKPLVLDEWDEELWISILESATVHKNGRITFLFKNGERVRV